jgi:hypothetical protein
MKDALEWIKGEYRQDQQKRLADHRLRLNIEDAFWNKEFFDALRLGNWSSSHSMQQNDVDDQFLVFAFLLLVDKSATWPPPHIPSDGIAIADMVQLGRNLMWFMDLGNLVHSSLTSHYWEKQLTIRLSSLITVAWHSSGMRRPTPGADSHMHFSPAFIGY